MSTPLRSLQCIAYSCALLLVASSLTACGGEGTSAAANPRLKAKRGTQSKGSTQVAKAELVYQWYGPDNVMINSMELRLDEQRLYGYTKDGQLMFWTAVSSGKQGHDTPTGSFKILQKSKNHKSNLYGLIVDKATDKVVNSDATPKTPVPPGCKYEPAPMPGFLRLTNTGVGFHGGYLPGHAASHGCVRLPYTMSEVIFDRVKLGTPVTIVQGAPSVSPQYGSVQGGTGYNSAQYVPGEVRP